MMLAAEPGAAATAVAGDSSGPAQVVSSSSSSNSGRLQLDSAFAAASGWLAVLPSLTVAQLSDHMEPSQPAAVKAAAARELARRLKKKNSKSDEWQRLCAALEACPQGISRLAHLLGEPDDDAQLAALEVMRQGTDKFCETLLSEQPHEVVAGLVQLLAEPNDDEKQLAALEVMRAGSNTFCESLLQQSEVVAALVQLLHGDDAAKQAAAAAVIYNVVVDGPYLSLAWLGKQLPACLAPPYSDPNSWPVCSGLVAVLKSTTASAEGKERAARVFCYLMRYALPGASTRDAGKLHHAAQAAVGPLVAMLRLDDIDKRGLEAAADAIYLLAGDCPPNQSPVGAEPCAISRLWQLLLDGRPGWPNYPEVSISDALAALCAGHGLNQSRLMSQDGFMEDLMKLAASDRFGWLFMKIASVLVENNPEFVLRMCNTPATVPALTGALFRKGYERFNQLALKLLLSMSQADPTTIHTISKQHPGLVNKLQKLSEEEELYPDAASLLQLVISLRGRHTLHRLDPSSGAGLFEAIPGLSGSVQYWSPS